jgi:hypothetical protein
MYFPKFVFRQSHWAACAKSKMKFMLQSKGVIDGE